MFSQQTPVCAMYLDEQIEKIIFESIWITFEVRGIFGGSWGSIQNLLKPLLQTTESKFNLGPIL